MPAWTPMPNGSGAAWFFDLRRFQRPFTEKWRSADRSYLRLANAPYRSSGICMKLYGAKLKRSVFGPVLMNGRKLPIVGVFVGAEINVSLPPTGKMAPT